ncbi:YrhK family protein [Haloglycomyces albus]|uniref:YrhK family protein n=1 Tax=Haloglycomyces albus TaxID=526067 RepID=UPI00046CCA6C|nr:YrhK family protein [Haloglycomyces albus]
MNSSDEKSLTFKIGHDELVIRQRYEALSIANDIMIGLWFVIGSIMFLSPSLAEPAVWLFILGSTQMLIRPVIRLTRHLHLQRFHPGRSSVVESPRDF